MFKLWCLAEDDLLREGNSYRLVNTGQVGRAAHHYARPGPRRASVLSSALACRSLPQPNDGQTLVLTSPCGLEPCLNPLCTSCSLFLSDIWLCRA